MRLSATLALLGGASSVLGLNILMNNDDGFAAANLRETYRLLKKEGHQVVVVAPVDNQSGMGGRSVFTTEAKLDHDSEYSIIKAGAPSIGRDPVDRGVWYYNGTPAACTFVGLDYVLPKFYPKMSPPDLVVAGPNFGTNLGGFLYTISGTMGATYAAVGRGVPAVAFSGGNTEQRSYQWINKTTPTGKPDPATLQAKLAVDVVNALTKGKKSGDRILPLGYGVSVNSPYITSLTNRSCINPTFVQTQLTGAAFSDLAVYDSTTKLFTYANKLGPGLNRQINGNNKLPGETAIVNGGCQSSMSVFSVDYDAPVGPKQGGIRKLLAAIAGDGITSDENLSERDIEEMQPRRHE